MVRRGIKRHQHLAPDVFATLLGPDLLDFIELPFQLRRDFIHLTPNQALTAQDQTRIGAQMVQCAHHTRVPHPSRRRLQAVDIALFTPAQGAVNKDMTYMM